MAQQTTFAQLNHILQRPINCLVDQDRNIRKQGLTIISNTLFTHATPLIIQIVEKTKLYKNLCGVVDDKIQKHRQIGIQIIVKYLKLVKNEKQINSDIIQAFLKSLISRVNSSPCAETCEDIRLQIVKSFSLFLKYTQPVIYHLSDISNAITKCLIDQFPDLKKQCCILINEITFDNTLKFKIGYTSTSIVKQLANNLGHQHALVRKVSIQSLGNLLITQGCGHNFEHVKQAIFKIAFNKSKDVKKATFECVSKLLDNFSLKLLSTYQSDLISILLSGLSDETPQLVQYTKELLQNSGNKLKQLDQENQKKSKMQIEA